MWFKWIWRLYWKYWIFLKEKCLQICIINSELKNRKKIYIKDIEEIYWEKYFFDQQENRKIKSMCDEISYSLVASESKLILYTLEIDNNKNLIQIEIGDDFYLKIKAKEVDIIQAINNSKKVLIKKEIIINLIMMYGMVFLLLKLKMKNIY